MMEVLASNNRALKCTTYDRSQCDIGIVHLGFGAFHRAHQAVYVDDYMEATGDLRWGIAAVNLRSSEAAAFAETQTVSNGYLLKTTSPHGVRNLRLVRSHCHFVDWSSEKKSAEDLLSLPSVHTVTMTVTESGYYLNSDWSLNVDDPLIAAELASGRQSSVYAYLTGALKLRMKTTGAPINILCCDNIRSNGHMLEANFRSYLEQLGENALLEWVEENASFPCSMVDRITPRATDDLVAEIKRLFLDLSLSPIHGESFIQWVLEDKFKAPMPELAAVGVEVVRDVDPYEEAKIRILNGGHTGLCYLGALAGHSTFDAAFEDPPLRRIFDRFELNEVLPGLEDVDVPFSKRAYLDTIAERFSNAAIADQLERICMDGYSKMPIYIRPTLEACFRKNIIPHNGFACVASWVVYARRWALGTMQVPYHEPYWDVLEPLLAPEAQDKLVRHEPLWANLPTQYPQFASQLSHAIDEMERKWPA